MEVEQAMEEVRSDKLHNVLGAIENLVTSPSKDDKPFEPKKQSKTSHKLSAAVKRRLSALKKLEYESIKQEVNYFIEIHALEVKYHEILAPFEQRRCDIVNGLTEPTDEDCDWSTDESEAENDSKSTESPNPKVQHPKEQEVKGIPDFWLNLLENRTFLIDQIRVHDRPVLKQLRNIKSSYLPSGYQLDFVFGENEFFSDEVLTKKYFIDFTPFTARGKKLTYYGPINVGFEGCAINWKDGMDVTRIADSDGTGFKESFFNFFTRSAAHDPNKDDDETCAIEREFEFARILRQHVLPRAAGVYTKNYFADFCDGEFDSYVEEEDEDYDPSME